MITEKRKWLTYSYFNRDPVFSWMQADLFSPVKKNIPGMVRLPFPTMIIHLEKENTLDQWSRSIRYKVNRAEKENPEIKRGNILLADILDLFRKTAFAKGLHGFQPEDFNSKPWIECSAVFENNHMLAGHVWLMDYDEKRILLFVNASDHHDEESDASLVGRMHYFLLWQDVMHFRHLGFKVMDLNGYNPNTTDPALKGVYTWKEGTHGEKEDLFQYYPLHVHWLKKFRNMAVR